MRHHPLVQWLPAAAASIGVAVVLTAAVFFVVQRAARHWATGEELRRRCRRPASLAAVMLGLTASLDGAHLPAADSARISHGASLGLIAAIAWLLIEISFVIQDAALRRYDIEVSDNLRARRMRTQVLVMRRVTVIVFTVLAGAAMLTTFHQARALGTSMLASAGIAGLAAATAARPTLGNLVAGVQIAFSEPIRLDDVVVVEGEWGRVEEITLTYVVVCIWDARRLVLPISYFVENPFQNWTRSSAELLGTTLFHLDYRAPIGEMRAEFESFVASSPLWDGRVRALQVTDTSERTVEVRALMSAADSSSMFDLRCAVREHLVMWLQARHPDALPTLRTEIGAGEDATRELATVGRQR